MYNNFGGLRDTQEAYIKSLAVLAKAVAPLIIVCSISEYDAISAAIHAATGGVQPLPQLVTDQPAWKKDPEMFRRLNTTFLAMSERWVRNGLPMPPHAPLSRSADFAHILGPKYMGHGTEVASMYVSVQWGKLDAMALAANLSDAELITWVDAGIFRHPKMVAEFTKACIPYTTSARFATMWPWAPWPDWNRSAYSVGPLREVLATVFTVERKYLLKRLKPAFHARARLLLDLGLATQEQGVLGTLLPELPEVEHIASGYDCILQHMLSCDGAAGQSRHTESRENMGTKDQDQTGQARSTRRVGSMKACGKRQRTPPAGLGQPIPGWK